MKKVAVLVGSLRRESINGKLARVLARLAKDHLEFDIIDLANVPMYNDELWENVPEAVIELKQRIAKADGVLFMSPEYNRSFTAVLKNAIDWGTRPYGQNSFSGKPGAIIGTSPGAIGSAVGQSQLRSVLGAIQVVVMGQPEIYLSWNDDLVDADDNVVVESTKRYLETWVDHFTRWIERLAPPA
ncbi:NADPH-dependent FMN reductase [Phyllobacterium zundukense]|uniref:NADPH-dependent FMN reductase n=1 Tax=Phyllobacterium zundukense TaxID=1867719 RepID=A0A2N9VVG8_9HYPH|nr:NAD(P)H-dependent oxidoreductase [Phyllobacterium zundukense]ATU92961.1 NADPH-dependent FMN reductase [Phyllobacterium zundukense]PIO43486.1 NADPH-dependent FMN reductase [Phyllobacterium zundukense]